MRASEGEKDPEAGFVLRGVAAMFFEFRMISVEEDFARLRRDFALAIGECYDFVQNGDIYQRISGLASRSIDLAECSPSSVRGGAAGSCPASSMDFVGDTCGRIDECS